MKILDTGETLPLTGKSLVCEAFPPPQMTPLRLLFDGERKVLADAPAPQSSICSYKAKSGKAAFDCKFLSDTSLCGPLRVCLNVSLDDGNDSNVFVIVQKILKTGRPGAQLKVPYDKSWQSYLIRAAKWTGLVPELKVLFYEGPTGQMRVSRRRVLSTNSVPGFPVSDGREAEFVSPGEVVRLDVPMTPIGMSFAAGESLRVTIQGKDPSVYPPVDQGTLVVEGVEVINEDFSVNVHCGGSFIELPVIPSLE